LLEVNRNVGRRLIASALLLIICLATSIALYADDNSLSLKHLRTIQKQVENCVSKNMASVVAISDGKGFGSGVVINESGLIMTAGHVVNGSPAEVEIFFPSGVTTQARIVGFNLDVDAALLQITEPGKWPYSELAENNSTQVGDWVVCLGHSGGYEVGRKPPVRTGRVLEFREHLMVTDAALIGGDSGGPLFDLNGKVVGIHSSIGDLLSENRHVQVSTFRSNWDRMAKGGRWGKLIELVEPESQPKQRAKMGVEMEEIADRAIIKIVNPNSPAARVGLKPGDHVRKFENQLITNPKQLIALIREKNVGDSISLEIERRGQVLSLTIILEDLK
jgi:serine protease Do